MNKFVLLLFCLTGCTSSALSERTLVKPFPIEKLNSSITKNFPSAQPIFRQDAVCPPQATSMNQNGWVILSFDINESGKIKNIQIVDSSPKGFGFERSAKRTIKKWKYNPAMVKGIPVYSQDVRTSIQFEICN